MFQTKNRRLYGVIVIVVLAVGAIFFSLFRGADSLSLGKLAPVQTQQTQQTESQSSHQWPSIDSVAAGDLYVQRPPCSYCRKDYGTIEATLTQTLRLLRFPILRILPSQASIMAFTFHRIDGFMIQGGDPMGNGSWVRE